MSNDQRRLLEVETFANESKFILRGTINKNASKAFDGPITDNTVILRINQVFKAPKVLGNLGGKDVAIELKDSKRIDTKSEQIFFANAWWYGKQIGLLEVGRTTTNDSDDMHKVIFDLEKKSADQALEKRLDLADLVITGKVLETRPVSMKSERKIISEHSAVWWEALIQVDSVEKGQHEDKISVIFPSSMDEIWIDSPKFKPGDTGIWILQKDQQEKGLPLDRIPGYSSLDRLDFQSIDQLDRIQSFIKPRR
jgi:hypothetical protein